MMKLLLTVALVLAPYASAYQTSDLEESGKFSVKGLVSFIKKAENFFGKVHSGFSLYGHDEGPGEENWGGVCSSGDSQSPIDFKENETEVALKEPLRFSGIFQTPLITNITHSGDTVKIKLKTATPITVTGGVFDDRVYEFQQLHFHWGRNVHEGSEHTVESERFPLECHLVFYKANSSNPTAEVDGMAVLGVHYEARWTGSNVLDPVVKAAKQIEKIDQYVANVGGYPLRKYMPDNIDTYFSYNGSLTTPPCTEGVTWVWFTDKQKVSNQQVKIFKGITDELGHKVKSNFRGTQPLNGRSVYLVNPWNRGGVCSSGKLQSPIDFKQNETEIAFKKPLRFSGVFQTPLITNITHSGDTVKILLKTATPITVTGGVFGRKVYKFQQLHFHWGKNTREGSEHTIESKRFPLECHLVFNKAKRFNPTADANSIAVLGVHYKANRRGSNVLHPVVKTVKKIEEVGQYVVKVGGYPLRKYMPDNIDTYFSYIGSLTTPPCTEGVTWVWFTDKKLVSNHQDKIFHYMHDELGHHVMSNFRRTQPLNGRSVFLVNPW